MISLQIPVYRTDENIRVPKGSLCTREPFSEAFRLRARFYHGSKFDHGNLVGACLPQTLHMKMERIKHDTLH